jgi:hypothetical protein
MNIVDIKNMIENGDKRKCKQCNTELPITEFYIKTNKITGNCRFNSPCKKCFDSKRDKNYYKIYNRKLKYNLSEAQYDNMLLEQNNCCAICGVHKDNNKKEFSVDHCHENGKIRGLLCNNCNVALGLFKDNINIMKNAVVYLNNNNEITQSK